jgi:hypothetical protein
MRKAMVVSEMWLAKSSSVVKKRYGLSVIACSAFMKAAFSSGSPIVTRICCGSP